MNDQNDAIVVQLRVVVVGSCANAVHALFFFCLVFLFLYYYRQENRRRIYGSRFIVLWRDKEGRGCRLVLLMPLLFCDDLFIDCIQIILLFSGYQQAARKARKKNDVCCLSPPLFSLLLLHNQQYQYMVPPTPPPPGWTVISLPCPLQIF